MAPRPVDRVELEPRLLKVPDTEKNKLRAFFCMQLPRADDPD